MKLRNKQTGEIIEKYPDRFVINSGEQIRVYDSLAKLNAEWEDVPEEPKEYWYIENNGDVDEETYDGTYYEEKMQAIGNYFETKVEAEKAVEKLKAWKRLKDKGFRFTFTPGVGSLDITPDKFQIGIIADMPAKWFCCDAVQKDLDACFGGEE